MPRKLASIQRIWKIEPIEGADNIELASIMGWKCVIKKNIFKVYDLACYIEIDSVCPKEDPRFAMLASTNWKVKTRKMRGTLSQGLIISLQDCGWTELDVTLEEDVTDKLGIKLFENYESFNATEAKGGFPGFLRKSDQERIQNLSDRTFRDYSKMLWQVDEKIEGASGTFFIRDGEYFACSRNLVMKLIDGSRWKHLTEKYDLENKLRSLNRNIAIQAETIGPGIQGNYYNLKSYEMRIFDVFDIDEQRFLNSSERYDILKKIDLMQIHVPIIQKEFSFDGMSKDDMLSMADGLSSLCNKKREGLVWKCIANGEYHFKTVSNLYLLKTDQ